MSTSKPTARIVWPAAVALMMSVIAIACSASRQGSKQSADNGSGVPAIDLSAEDPAADSDDPCGQMFSTFFVDVDSISHAEYEVTRLHKTIRDSEYGADIPVTFAILKSRGQTIATFEGVYFGAGNQTSFGFASLLGGETTQLVVSQTIPRGGRHWIVDLSSNARTVFDSKEWELGQEDVCVHDYDGDGFEEISAAITSFWGFGPMSMAESPMPSVVFQYDPMVRKYLPDIAAFSSGLIDIDKDVQNIDPDEDPSIGSRGEYLATRLDILLRFVYAGRESAGWAFFDNTYNLDDKQTIEGDIKRILNKEPVYRFIRGMP